MLTDEVINLTAINSSLKARMNRDYINSSIPSSQKPAHKKIKNSRESSNRKPGGQPGHAGHKRPHLTPTETIDIPIPHDIANNSDYYLTGKTITKQLVDLEVSVKVTEFSTPEYRSHSTGKRGHAPFPAGVINETNYGNTSKAFAFLLNNYCNVSIDKTQEFMSGLTNDQICLSKGMINGLSKTFSSSTEQERQKIYSRLLMSPVMYSDATNGRVNGKGTYVIICANENELLYFFREHKGHSGLENTPVSEYQQTLVHDHDKTYYNYGDQHQECLAHVLRYLQDSIDNEPNLTWNHQMKDFLTHMIHDVKNNRSLSNEQISNFEKQYDKILKTGDLEYTASPPSKYYREGFNLHKRLSEYKTNHLLFSTSPRNRVYKQYFRKSSKKVQAKAKAIGHLSE
jgi:hypothetical protein